MELRGSVRHVHEGQIEPSGLSIYTDTPVNQLKLSDGSCDMGGVKGHMYNSVLIERII